VLHPILERKEGEWLNLKNPYHPKIIFWKSHPEKVGDGCTEKRLSSFNINV
jgi:hypothetical protein